MSDNVIGLHGQPTGNAPSPVLISTLEDMLERARAGEAVGAIVILLHSDNAASYTLAGRVGGYSMQGALEIARAELVDVNRG